VRHSQVRIAGVPVLVLPVLAACVLAAACGSENKSPTSPSSPSGSSGPATVVGLTLTGLQNYGSFVLVGETVRLQAMEQMSDKTTRACTDRATWKSSDVSTRRSTSSTTASLRWT